MYTRSHLWYFFRQFKRHDYVAQLLGIYNLKKEPILVLDGHLSPARKHLLKDHALKVLLIVTLTYRYENSCFSSQKDILLQSILTCYDKMRKDLHVHIQLYSTWRTLLLDVVVQVYQM